MAVSPLSGSGGVATQLQRIEQVQAVRGSLAPRPSLSIATINPVQPAATNPAQPAATNPVQPAATVASGASPVAQPAASMLSYLLPLQPDAVSAPVDGATQPGSAPVGSSATNAMAASQYAAAGTNASNFVSSSMVC